MDEFVIIVDKQEKHNYIFNENIKIEVVSLNTGDYTLKGFEDQITIERKSLNDMAKSVTTTHDQFFKEIKRLQKFDFACIIVEAELPEILKHLYDSPTSPDTIIGNLLSIVIHYKVPVFLCSDRQHALYLTEKILRMYYEHKKTKFASQILRGKVVKKKKGRPKKEEGQKEVKRIRKKKSNLPEL